VLINLLHDFVPKLSVPLSVSDVQRRSF